MPSIDISKTEGYAALSKSDKMERVSQTFTKGTHVYSAETYGPKKAERTARFGVLYEVQRLFKGDSHVTVKLVELGNARNTHEFRLYTWSASTGEFVLASEATPAELADFAEERAKRARDAAKAADKEKKASERDRAFRQKVAAQVDADAKQVTPLEPGAKGDRWTATFETYRTTREHREAPLTVERREHQVGAYITEESWQDTATGDYGNRLFIRAETHYSHMSAAEARIVANALLMAADQLDTLEAEGKRTNIRHY